VGSILVPPGLFADFKESVAPGLNGSENWSRPLVFGTTDRSGPTVSLKFLENSGFIFYHVGKVLASFEGIQTSNQKENIDGNR